MSGHNKWSKIKHKKAATDAKKSKLFSVLVKTIALESKEASGDKNHPKLKAVIDRAKAVNMPNENIDRAVLKGASKDSANLESVIYEAYGPHGVAIIAEGITDNRNRTTAEIKHLLSKNGGNVAVPGSTLWAFSKKDDGWQANDLIPLKTKDKPAVEKIITALIDHDDIDNIYTNSELSQIE